MTDYGFKADIDQRGRVGWSITADGQIARATSIKDKVLRLLRPLWGGVWCEPYRGTAARPGKMIDAINVVVSDRINLVLSPLVVNREIKDLVVNVVKHPHGDEKRCAAAIAFADSEGRPHKLEFFVKIP